MQIRLGGISWTTRLNHLTIVERGVISQIELLYTMLISLDKLTEEIDFIFWFGRNFTWKSIIQKFRTHTTLMKNATFTM